MLSLWLRSETNQAIYVDFDMDSSYRAIIYTDLHITSSVSVNPARDFHLTSELYDLSGDWAIISSFINALKGDISLLSGYRHNFLSLSDFSLVSSFNISAFNSLSISSSCDLGIVNSLTLASRITQNVRRDLDIKSHVRKISFCDHSFSSFFKFLYTVNDVSFSLESSVICVGIGSDPLALDLSSYLSFLASVYIGKGYVENVIFDVGQFTLTIDLSVSEGIYNIGSVSMARLNILGTHAYTLGKPLDVIMRTLSIGTYPFLVLEYETDTMSDFISNNITMEIRRDIQDQDYVGFDRFGIDIHISSYSINKADAKAIIKMKYVNILFVIKGSSFFNLITLPANKMKVDRGLVAGFVTNVRIASEVSIFKIEDHSFLSKIKGYSIGSNKIVRVGGFTMFPFFLESSTLVNIVVSKSIYDGLLQEVTEVIYYDVLEQEASLLIKDKIIPYVILPSFFMKTIDSSGLYITRLCRISESIITEVMYPSNNLSYSSNNDLLTTPLDDLIVTLLYKGEYTIDITIGAEDSTVFTDATYSVGSLYIPETTIGDLLGFTYGFCDISWVVGGLSNVSEGLYKIRIRRENYTYPYFMGGHFSYIDKVNVLGYYSPIDRFSANLFFSDEDTFYSLVSIGGVL